MRNRTRHATSLIPALVLIAGMLASSPAAAQLSFSGDARFRPRIDLDDRSENPAVNARTRQFYFMYRIRLDATAVIGNGYYVKSRVAHNGVGTYVKVGATGEQPDVLGAANTLSEEGGRRAGLDLMYMYIGRNTPRAGFDVGLLPVPGFSNPLWDLHYYPQTMIDVPYFLFHNDGGTGAQAYVGVGPGRLTGQLFVDRDREEARFDPQDTRLRENTDQFTLGLTYSLPIAGIRIEPQVMKTIGGSVREAPGGVTDPARSGQYNDPLTIGANVVVPVRGPLSLTTTAGWTRSGASNSLDSPAPAYDGWLARVKLAGKVGPGTLLTWFDYAQRTDNGVGAAPDATTDFAYAWLGYTMTVFSGEHGSFAVGPAWRIMDTSNDNATLRRRHKIELNFDATFR